MRVYIRENSWLARLAALKLKSAKMAIVFGRTIHLHNTSREEFLANKQWVCHELKHVEQFRRYGRAGFITRYLLESIRKGYHDNFFEREAREQEGNVYLLRGITFD